MSALSVIIAMAIAVVFTIIAVEYVDFWSIGYDLKEAAGKIRIKTKHGVIYMPSHRPETYFKEGSELTLVNAPITDPEEFGADRFMPELPEGVYRGIIISNEESVYDEIAIRLLIGEKETECLKDCPAVMHDWEYNALKKSALLRKLWSFFGEAKWFSLRGLKNIN